MFGLGNTIENEEIMNDSNNVESPANTSHGSDSFNTESPRGPEFQFGRNSKSRQN